ncbi:tyrosine-type recombinase/integrase [Pseudomonas sp. gcc21]|uniref:tyrosine-type recombinase/integrase n=1 Tax=Pseudomonas sp. gcc21 TaxID=2726989 RepID=UPI001451135C|nr:tyrosine-type recombinase/integrase [Pseudomonas sp. gcc21]QJD58154.1 tyrosine-type recombinase/integrase [Pseudomonas sp. gcc21]
MSPRRRGVGNRTLPANLYPNGKYFQYRNPLTGKKTSINKTLQEAIKLANAANAKLMPLVADSRLFELITGEEAPKLLKLLDRFETEWLPERDLAPRTLAEVRIKLERYRKDLGSKLIGQLDVLELAEYLDQFSNNAYTKHRGLMIQIWTFAVAKGLADRNVAELTLRKKEAEKKRQRHTEAGVKRILEADTTPAWLKRAIRLALLSLQRREDLVRWERSAVDMAANTIRISASKTQNYDKPVHLEIDMGPDLRELVQECLSEPILSPYLICYKPKRRQRSQMEAKLHWSAVTEDYFSKAFRTARDECGAYDHIAEPAARPTVHELRALGAWMYQKQGFEQEYIQALMGHATEEMTAYYQEGHEAKKGPAYLRVQAGLKL